MKLSSSTMERRRPVMMDNRSITHARRVFRPANRACYAARWSKAYLSAPETRCSISKFPPLVLVA